MMAIDLDTIQAKLQKNGLDGWLIYDFRRSNDIAHQLLEIPLDTLVSRRFFYWIPSHGKPLKIMHAIELHVLDHLPGHIASYSDWQSLYKQIALCLENAYSIAMEYSPNNELPYLSKVDAGTMEMIRIFGVSVVSSAELIHMEWTSQQVAEHLQAAHFLDETALKTWEWIAHNLSINRQLKECDVQSFILEECFAKGFLAEDGVICAVNQNSANPHYHAIFGQGALIRPGDYILIDLACRKKGVNTVYADITRVAIAASKPTPKQQHIFTIVQQAQDAALSLIKKRFQVQQTVCGFEVDDAAREVIKQAGYGAFFTHRTGHNLDVRVHGLGTHMDNFETHDTRSISVNSCFTIEPGIYLPGEFGVRLEYDVLILPDQIMVTGGEQNSIVCLT